MATEKRKAPWGVLLLAGILAPVAAAAVWFSLDRGFNPHYQQRVAMAGMGEHPVNLWTEPHPPRVGVAELTVEVTGAAGGPILQPDTLVFQVSRPGERPVAEIPGVYSDAGPGHGRVHVGTVEFDAPGSWEVAVGFSMGEAYSEASFILEVNE